MNIFDSSNIKKVGDPLLLFITSIVAGLVGSILGLGGGIIIIPALTLLFGVDIRYAIGASIISVIATSCGAAATYVRDHLTNVRLAIFLEVATTLGAIGGAVISSYISPRILFCLFSLFLLQSAFLMWKKGQHKISAVSKGDVGHPWAHKLGLNSSYPDHATNLQVAYLVEKVPLGFFYMIFAGMLSGLLGIGGGALKVLAMDSAMKLPIKVSSATSNFMIGVTAAASAGTYFMRGDILPELAAPVALGVLFGAALGTQLMMRLPSEQIRKFFTLILLILALQMSWRGISLFL